MSLVNFTPDKITSISGFSWSVKVLQKTLTPIVYSTMYEAAHRKYTASYVIYVDPCIHRLYSLAVIKAS